MKNIFLKLTLTAFITAGIILSSHAQAFWNISAGFNAGNTRNSCIARNPDTEMLIIGTFGQGIFTSPDQGVSWKTSLKIGADQPVLCLYVSGNGAIYAGSTGAVYRSLDKGDTWGRFVPDDTYPDNPVLDMVENSKGELFITTGFSNDEGAAVYYSKDQGKTWKPCSNGLPAGYPGSKITIDQQGRLFVAIDDVTGNHSGGLFFSTDDGATWQQLVLYIDGKNVIDNKVTPNTISSLEITKENLIAVSFEGTAGPVAVEMNLISTFEAAIARKPWEVETIFQSNMFWMAPVLGSRFTSANNITLGSMYGSQQVGGVYMNDQSWSKKNTGLQTVNGFYHPTSFVQMSNGTVYMIQQEDSHLYYTDSLRKVSTGVKGEFKPDQELITYPNPSNGQFSISFISNTASTADISIFTLNGKMIFSGKQVVENGRNNLQLNNSTLEPGLYLVQVKLQDEILRQKISIR